MKMFTYLSALVLLLTGCGSDSATAVDEAGYLLHKDIAVTIFWVGEEASAANDYISNTESAWDIRWMEHFGGVDDPDNRQGFEPIGFTPLENPFYFALPYNDFTSSGRKASAFQVVPWADEKSSWPDNESMCKNRWIKISKNGATAYAQWQDSGPFQYDDANYVFGTAQPLNSQNGGAGLDVSPAIRDYLGLRDIDAVDWAFVDASDVPDGPWKSTVTTSLCTWN